MKTLLIVRHGKSSWDDPSLSDRERPLKERGVNDAGKMASLLAEDKIIPDLVISSPALRARQTAEIFCEVFQYPAEKIQIEDDLYFSGVDAILQVVTNIDNRYDTVMIAGHNPDFTDLANKFLSQSLYNLPTAGVVVLIFDTDNWENISRKILERDICLIPKKF